jgi:hypothetical protein
MMGVSSNTASVSPRRDTIDVTRSDPNPKLTIKTRPGHFCRRLRISTGARAAAPGARSY